MRAWLAEASNRRAAGQLTLAWAHQLGTASFDSLRAVAMHPDGGIVAVGSVPVALPEAASSGGIESLFLLKQ